MSKKETFLGFTREQLQDIGLGVGRGFQAHDPNNPFRATGAAMEGTIASGLMRESKDEERQNRLDDIESADKSRREAEARAASERIAAEKRNESRVIEGEKRRTQQDRDQYNWMVAQEEERKKREKAQRGAVKVFDRGSQTAFNETFARLMGGNAPRVGTTAPKSWNQGRSPIQDFLDTVAPIGMNKQGGSNEDER